MIIACPECKLQLSDKAIACPHCGYPMLTDKEKTKRSRHNRRKRLPNGFGQITEIKGRGLRKPFRAMVTVGKTDEGRPICKLLKPNSYFETYNDAYAALFEYNRNPYDLSADITMDELYSRWSEEYFKKVSSVSAKNVRCTWTIHCKAIHSMRLRDVRTRHLKGLIETEDTTPGNKTLMKMVLNLMFDFAVEYELIDRNYARDFRVEKVDKSKETGEGAHKTFTDDELAILWGHVGECVWIDMAIVQCYSGWRPGELCKLEKKNVDFERMCMTGGSKTESGKDRDVPIHSKIVDIVRLYASKGDSEYLFGEIKYEQYRHAFHREMRRIGISDDHAPHDCRVCFVTKAKKYNVNEYAIKRIVGHIIADITERIYTKRNFEWLKEEIEKIK